jgi:hypothetical protein
MAGAWPRLSGRQENLERRGTRMETVYESFEDIDQLETEYLLPGSAFRIPRGDLTLLYGTGGVGKGRLLMSVIADVVNDGGSVIVILPEDHPNEQVRPRLEAAGVEDLSRVINMTRLPNGGARFNCRRTSRGIRGIFRCCGRRSLT